MVNHPNGIPIILGIPGGSFISPPTVRSPATVSAQVHTQHRHANKHRAANHDPLRQVGIHHCIENTDEKRSVRGFDARASLKPRFSYGERAWRPRNQFDDDGVDERSDVQCPQKRTVARYYPAKRDPATPKQVQEQDGFRENRKNRSLPLRCRVRS